MLPGQLNQRNAINNRAAINNANGAIIEATISIVRNPGTGATALLTEETLIFFHSIYFKNEIIGQPPDGEKTKRKRNKCVGAAAHWLDAVGAGYVAENWHNCFMP